MTDASAFPSPVGAEDVSVVFSVKVDSPQRKRNLEYNLEYLRTVANDVELLVIEQGSKTDLDPGCTDESRVDHFVVPGDGSHWKTRNFNLGAKLARRSILLFLDCDVLLTTDALNRAIAIVREHGGFVQPFNGVLVEFDDTLVDNARDIFALLRDPAYFAPDYDRDLARLDFTDATPLYGGSDYLATGGAVLCDRRDFFLLGGYNENFVSYGFEDMELFERITKCGYSIERISDANAYHLPHPRGIDSTYNNYYRTNEQEFARVRGMSADELRRYAHNGFREVHFDGSRVLKVTQSEHHYHLDLLPDDRLSMGDLELVFLVFETGSGHSDERLESVFAYLEQFCTHYRIVCYERGGRTLRHPRNMKNYLYTWLDAAQISEQQAQDLVRARTQPRLCLEIVDRNYDPGPLMRRLRRLRETTHVNDPAWSIGSHA